MSIAFSMPSLFPDGGADGKISEFVDVNGDKAYIPAGFTVSEKADERTIRSGLVVIGPDGSEFVWIPTGKTPLKRRDFHCDFYGSMNSIDEYYDETDRADYCAMEASVAKYGGFYMGRYEATRGGGSCLADSYPTSRRVTADRPGRVWVRISPEDATRVCANLYRDNPTVQGFFPWGANWDTMLQWLIDSGAKTLHDIAEDSTPWGNYSNCRFGGDATVRYTGAYEQAKANNLYDVAGNNWHWTQERHGRGSYVLRGGGTTLMGGPCRGDHCPAAIRDPLPGSKYHPNVTFRVALFLK